MKTTEDIELTTAGKLLDELKGFEKKYWHYNVVAWVDDDHTVGVVGIWQDEDDDLRIEVEVVEEELEGIWTVDDVIESLERCDKDTRVYLAGHGYYFAIDSEGSIFTDSDDDEVVGCYAYIFGEYHISSWQTPQDLRDIAEERRKRKREARHEKIALVIITIAVFGWLVYNIYALCAGIGGPTWEKILWIVVCCIVLFINGSTLYYDKE